MSKNYEDWADWAGDHPEQAEAELRAKRGYEQCEHEEIDNQGVCTDCGIEVEGWEPDETQMDQHYGTGVAA
jgi:hypothetical protein